MSIACAKPHVARRQEDNTARNIGIICLYVTLYFGFESISNRYYQTPTPIGTVQNPLRERLVSDGQTVYQITASPAGGAFMAIPVPNYYGQDFSARQPAIVIGPNEAPLGIPEFVTRTTRIVSAADQQAQIEEWKKTADQYMAQGAGTLSIAFLCFGVSYFTRRR